MNKGSIMNAVVYNKSTSSSDTRILIDLGCLKFVDPESVKGYVDLLKLKRSNDDSRIIRVVNSPAESVNDECICNFNSFEPYFERRQTFYPITLGKVKRLVRDRYN